MLIFYPLVGALFLAGVVKTALATSKVRLFQSTLTVSDDTAHADLVGAEATYDGYAAKTVTAWLDAYYDPAGGATIQSGTQQFEYVDSTTHVSNAIGGAWIEDSTGKLLAIIELDHPLTLAKNGDAIPLDIALNYGRNS